MFPDAIFVVGNKRKLSHSSDVSSSSNLKETIALVESDILESHVDEVIDNYIHNIRNGNNPDLNRRAAALDKLKEKHIASADRHRKLQIKNINQLYEFEVEDAEALYAVILCFSDSSNISINRDLIIESVCRAAGGNDTGT